MKKDEKSILKVDQKKFDQMSEDTFLLMVDL